MWCDKKVLPLLVMRFKNVVEFEGAIKPQQLNTHRDTHTLLLCVLYNTILAIFSIFFSISFLLFHSFSLHSLPVFAPKSLFPHRKTIIMHRLAHGTQQSVSNNILLLFYPLRLHNFFFSRCLRRRREITSHTRILYVNDPFILSLFSSHTLSYLITLS